MALPKDIKEGELYIRELEPSYTNASEIANKTHAWSQKERIDQDILAKEIMGKIKEGQLRAWRVREKTHAGHSFLLAISEQTTYPTVDVDLYPTAFRDPKKIGAAAELVSTQVEKEILKKQQELEIEPVTNLSIHIRTSHNINASKIILGRMLENGFTIAEEQPAIIHLIKDSHPH